jgi:AraC-like DNA-binding protein
MTAVTQNESVAAPLRTLSASVFVSATTSLVVQLLPHGHAQMAEVCRKIGVNARTMSRRLASEKLTFAKLLDDLRHDLAKRYLREPDLPISEIAWLLGYRQTSSFNHAFKRWTGARPSRMRASSV